MQTTLAFDIYGTLIDTHGVVGDLEKIIGDAAAAFSRTWRDKQLEYTFRRGLMQSYENFDVCTSQALDYACACYKAGITKKQKLELLGLYRALPAFEDVKDGLTELKEKGFRMYAFTNGREESVEDLLASAGLRDFFIDIVSVDSQRTYKPAPDVYGHFLKRAAASGNKAWLISSNPFDIIGAMTFGMKTVWVKRTPDVVFDPWGIDPTLTVGSLSDLGSEITAFDTPIRRTLRGSGIKSGSGSSVRLLD